MHAQVVEREHGAEHLLEVGYEAGRVHRPIKLHDDLQALQDERGHHRHVCAVVQWHRLIHPTSQP
jgi:hypothetical protein